MIIRRRWQPPLFHTEARWLFDVMAALAIIGILASLAVKSYHSLIAPTSLSNVISSINSLKTEIYYRYAMTGMWPSAADLSEFDNFSDESLRVDLNYDVVVREGDIIITFANAHQYFPNKTLMLRKAEFIHEPRAPVIWLCGYQAVPDGMRASEANSTNIPSHLLTRICS